METSISTIKLIEEVVSSNRLGLYIAVSLDV